MRRLVLIGSTVMALAFSLVPGSPASATGFLGSPVPPPNDKIVVDVVTINGTGCRPGTARTAVSADNTAFTVSYSEYIAQIGPGIPSTESRKNCLLSVRVRVPSGFTFAIASLDTRGFASLGAGAKATATNSFWFQGNSATLPVAHDLMGPLDNDWQTTDSTPITALVWHPCGAQRNLNINTSLRVLTGTDRTLTNWVGTDAHDGSVETLFHYDLVWQRC
jgi:hypothetical protein